MGDRGNIVIEADGQTFPHEVYLYTHWDGSNVKKTLKKALVKGRDRWDDPQYLARVIFQTLIDGDQNVTGYGLSTKMGDGGTEIYVNLEQQKVKFKQKEWSFENFVKE